MSAIATSYNQEGPDLGKLIKLFILAAFAIAVALMFHASLNHGDEAEQVRQCINRNGTLELWSIPEQGKFYRVCNMGELGYGIQALIKGMEDEYREITAFIRKSHGKPVSLENVHAYLEKLGAIRFK